MPLNLSTKPPSSYAFTSNTTTNHQNTRANSIIWSPASMCEQEKSSDAMSSVESLSENVENRNNFMKHYNNLKNLSLLQNARSDNFGKIEKGYFTHLQQQHKKLLDQNNSVQATNGGNNFSGNRNLFILNNNNMLVVNDKETRPDSTAHSDTTIRVEGELRRRERNFQVSLSVFNVNNYRCLYLKF